MKVLIINLRIGTGSVGRIVSDIYHGVIESGNECKVAYARGGIDDLPDVDTYKICSENEVRMHAALTRLFGNTAFYFANSTNVFCEWISKYDPDIIHLHGVYGYYLNMEVLFDFLSRSKAHIISTLHSCWDFTGHCCYFDYVKCSQWKNGCKHCKNKHSYPMSSFLDNTSRNYMRKKEAYSKLKKCTIVTPSVWLEKYIHSSFLGNIETRVIYNGIDLSSFKEYKEKSSLVDNINKPIILCVASIWEKRKGWEDVVELSHILPDDYQLVVVGMKKNQIKKLARETITVDRTDSKEELAKLYSSATVLFNPTYEDNYPTVNLESIACHTPVVTYNTGGSPEALKKQTWGKIIEYRNYKELLKYTSEVFEDSNVFDDSDIKILSNCYMVEEYIKLYHKCTDCDSMECV